jgi:hypothetical protein
MWMIPVQEAVKIASEYVKALFPEGRDWRLEEVEVDDKGAWDITVSFLGNGTGSVTTPLGREPLVDPFRRTAIGIDPRRSFKSVELDTEGKVKAVRIRPIVVG